MTQHIRDGWRSLKHLRNPLKNLSFEEPLARETIKARLDEITTLVGRLEGPFIGVLDLDESRVDLCLLAIDPPYDENATRSSLFFQPWSESRLHKYPKDLDAPEDKKRFERSSRFLDYGPSASETRVRSVDDVTEYVAFFFVQSLVQFPRKGPEGPISKLGEATGWRYVDFGPCGPHEVLQEAKDEKFYWNIRGSWVLPRGKSPKPHIKVTMHSGINAEEGCLLRVEVLVLLAAMRTRMDDESLKDHAIIPVMLFSFVGPRHGRILIAHFDGTKLLIEMSRLYRFTSADKESLLLFERFQAGGINPNKNTKVLFSKHLEHRDPQGYVA